MSSELIDTDISLEKFVRVNIHFIQKSDGTGNFTETSDGFGNDFNGYNVSMEMLHWINTKDNQTLNIPPDHSLIKYPINIKFVLDAVYFHQSDELYPNSFNSNCNDTYSTNSSEVMQCYMRGDGVSDHANNISSTSLNKYISLKQLVNRYSSWINNMENDNYSWFQHSTYGTTQHELYHLLTLSHTVRYNSGPPCPTDDSSACNDGCDDTPTPFEMVNDYNFTGNSTSISEPFCGWGNGNVHWCSNNRMDYSGSGALSPCQLERMHSSIDNGLDAFRLCKRLNGTNQLCSFSFPQISYYGSIVTIGGANCLDIPSSTDTPIVNSSNISQVFASQEVEINELEVKQGGYFEIFTSYSCN